MTTNGQRNAFEGRGAAGAWEIDMSMEENQVVPGTLADYSLPSIAGYYDSDVKTDQPGWPERSYAIHICPANPSPIISMSSTGQDDGVAGQLRVSDGAGPYRTAAKCWRKSTASGKRATTVGPDELYRVRFLIEKGNDGSLNLRMPPTPRLEFATAGNDTLTVTARELGLDAAVKTHLGLRRRLEIYGRAAR